jgi:hypothetical protein
VIITLTPNSSQPTPVHPPADVGEADEVVEVPVPPKPIPPLIDLEDERPPEVGKNAI